MAIKQLSPHHDAGPTANVDPHLQKPSPTPRLLDKFGDLKSYLFLCGVFLFLIVASGFSVGMIVLSGIGFLVVTICYLTNSETGNDYGAVFIGLVWLASFIAVAYYVISIVYHLVAS